MPHTSAPVEEALRQYKCLLMEATRPRRNPTPNRSTLFSTATEASLLERVQFFLPVGTQNPLMDLQGFPTRPIDFRNAQQREEILNTLRFLSHPEDNMAWVARTRAPAYSHSHLPKGAMLPFATLQSIPLLIAIAVTCIILTQKKVRELPVSLYIILILALAAFLFHRLDKTIKKVMELSHGTFRIALSGVIQDFAAFHENMKAQESIINSEPAAAPSAELPPGLTMR